jgi:hypothetical protein
VKMVSFEINTEHTALQRHNTENLKQIFPEKELRGLSPNFNIHVSAIFIFPQSVCLLCCRSTSQFTVDYDWPLPRREHSQILIQYVPKTFVCLFLHTWRELSNSIRKRRPSGPGTFYVLHSTLLHLPPLKFHCVEGCWDRTLTVATLALAVRLSNRSAGSHPLWMGTIYVCYLFRRNVAHEAPLLVVDEQVF